MLTAARRSKARREASALPEAAQVRTTAADYHETDNVLRADLERYCANCVKIAHKDDGRLVPFMWNNAQREVHAAIERQRELTGKVRAIVLKARQRGISTYVEARFYHQTTLSPGLGINTFIMTHLDDATQNLFDMVERIHENMPVDYRHRLATSNAKELKFAGTDAGYRVATAHNVSGAGRSLTLHRFHGSEVAYWAQAQAHFAGALQAVPKSHGTEVVLESTANGVGGVFYDQWELAIRGESEFIAIFLPWFDQEDYRSPVPDGFLLSTEQQEYAELYDLDMEQIVWMHFECIALGGHPGDIPPLFRQEYPGTAVEAFQATGQDSYIPSDLVMRARQLVLPDDPKAPLILGVDCAAGGKDKTRMRDRRGRRLGHTINIVMDTDKPSVVSDRIAVEIEAHNIFQVFVDLTGFGYGVVDNLRRMNYGDRVTGVNFGGAATEPEKYANKRAEMYGRCKIWLEDEGGADIDDDNVLHEDLCAATFRYRLNKHGRQLLLEEKDKLKKRLERQRSPDDGDAAVLTFAENVHVPQPRQSSWKDGYTGASGTGRSWLTR